jgi:hypothetical protein
MQTTTFILCVNGHGTEDKTGKGTCSHAGCTAVAQAVFNVSGGLVRPAAP